jgi:hypothetical protein
MEIVENFETPDEVMKNRIKLRKYLKELSPERADPFKDVDKTPDLNKRNYSNIL